MGRAITDITIIKKLKQDVDSLLLDHSAIAARMKIDKSTFSKYYNGVFTPSDIFIKKFYVEFKQALKDIEDVQPLIKDIVTFQHTQNSLDIRIGKIEELHEQLQNSHLQIIIQLQQLDKKIHKLENLIQGFLTEPFKKKKKKAQKKAPE